MRRREFIALVGGTAATWPLLARGQQGRIRQVGYFWAGGRPSDAEGQARSNAFRKGLKEHGWSEGQTIQIHFEFDRSQRAARRLLDLQPDVIFAPSSPSVDLLRRETRKVPIVFANVSDPVEAGFIANLARPGGNITGFTNFEHATAGKWLELLKELVPSVARAGMLLDTENPQSPGRLRALEQIAPLLQVGLFPLRVRSGPEITAAMTQFAREPGGGLLVPPGTLLLEQRASINALATKLKLPAVHANSIFVKDGGLLSYGVDAVQQCHQAATYVDRILKGESPADLPVQAPTKFELAINLNTAKALGLQVPPALLARADEVIE
jgi:putative ABC transport system substrate-binding protein